MKELVKRIPLRTPTTGDLFEPDVAERYPTLAERFDVSARVINPAFRRCDGIALRAQARFRRYRLAVLVTTALTACLGAVQTVAGDSPIPGLAIALVGLAAGLIIQIESSLEPGVDYLVARGRAEKLRSLHFRYLSGTFGDDEAALESEVARIEYSSEEGQHG